MTVLSLEGCQVVAQRTVERDGYSAIQVGAGKAKAKNDQQHHYTNDPDQFAFLFVSAVKKSLSQMNNSQNDIALEP